MVPPGRHEYRTLVTNQLKIPYDTTVHFIGVHAHPHSVALELQDVTSGESLFLSHQRTHGELDSLLITLINHSDSELPQQPWAWIKGKVTTLNQKKSEKILEEYETGVACDQGVNGNGNRRYAVAIESPTGLEWVLAAVLHRDDIRSCETPLIDQLAKSAKRMGYYLMDQAQ